MRQAGETKQGFRHPAKHLQSQWGTGDTTGAAPGREHNSGRAGSGCLQPTDSVPAAAAAAQCQQKWDEREKALLVPADQQLGWIWAGEWGSGGCVLPREMQLG